MFHIEKNKVNHCLESSYLIFPFIVLYFSFLLNVVITLENTNIIQVKVSFDDTFFSLSVVYNEFTHEILTYGRSYMSVSDSLLFFQGYYIFLFIFSSLGLWPKWNDHETFFIY